MPTFNATGNISIYTIFLRPNTNKKTNINSKLLRTLINLKYK